MSISNSILKPTAPSIHRGQKPVVEPSAHSVIQARVITRIGYLAAGALLLYHAELFWMNGEPLWNWEAVAMTLIGYGLAFALLFLGLIRRASAAWEWLILVAALVVLLGTYRSDLVTYRPGGSETTDAALFADYAARLQLSGENPYEWNLRDAFTSHRISTAFITPKIDGGSAEAVNHPALQFLVLVPLKAVGIEDLSAFYVLAHAVLLMLLFIHAPAPYRAIVLLPLLVSGQLLNYTLGGVTDIVWALLLVAMVMAWRRPTWRAIFYGLACAYKQQPWLLLPFLIVRLVLDREDPDRRPSFRRVFYFSAISGSAFLLSNLPYMISDFTAWFDGVLGPMQQPLVYLGSGLSTLTQSALISLPKSFYTLAGLSVMFGLMFIYAIRFRQLKHTMWIFPAVVMWFSYRSLQSYFIYWLPVMVAVVVEFLLKPQTTPQASRRSAKQSALKMHRSSPALLAGFWPSVDFARGSTFLRRFSTPLMALGAVAAFTVGIGIYYSSKAEGLLVEAIDLVSQDPYRVGELELRVSNTSDRAIEPRISVRKGSWQPYPWQIESGPLTIEPGESATYRATTDLPHRMINLADGARIIVSDGTGDYEILGSALIGRDLSLLDPDAIYNSTYSTGGEEGSIPWGWTFDGTAARDPDVRVIDSPEGFRQIEMSFEAEAGSIEWDAVGLSQWIPFPLGDFRAWVYPPSLNSDGAEDLTRAYGFEFDDGTHRLWVLFGPGSREGYISENHYVIHVDAPAADWSLQRFNLKDLYDRLVWPMPERQRIVRGDLELMTSVITVRLLSAAQQLESVERITARFGPLEIDHGSRPIADRIAETLENPSKYYNLLGDMEGQRRNFDQANWLYTIAAWFALDQGGTVVSPGS